jgi:hypothetical protein
MPIMSQPEGDTIYLAMFGRQAVCYATTPEIAKDMMEIYATFPDAYRNLAGHADLGMIPFLSKLQGVVIRRTIEWREELNGWSFVAGKGGPVEIFLRIERVNWGIKDPKPVANR